MLKLLFSQEGTVLSLISSFGFMILGLSLIANIIYVRDHLL